MNWDIGHNWSQLLLAWRLRANVEVVKAYPRPLIPLELIFNCHQGFMRGQGQPKSQADINQEENGRYFSPEKLFIIAGVALALSGFILLSKVLDEVYLSTGFNVNMEVCRFLAAGILVWLGEGIILYAYGLLF